MALIVLNNFPGGVMRRRDCIISVFPVLVLLTAGCAGQDVIVQKQTEMGARIEYLIQRNNAAEKRINELSNELKDMQDRIKTDSAAARQSDSSAKEPGDAVEAVAREKKPVVSPTESVTKIELINRDAASKGRNDKASAAYLKAFGLYSANKYAMAIDAFNSFLHSYPATEYAVNAQYWLGECYYSQSDLPKALDAFNEVVERYPNGKKVPDALLKIGYTLFAMKDQEKARAVLTALTEKFPDSPAAAKARERLNSL
jgi:tol-pal system protein YbgF